MAVVSFYEPLEFNAAFFLLVYGIWIGRIDAELNPRPSQPDNPGPWLPWNRMSAGDKLEYHLPGLFLVSFGVLLMVMAFVGSDRLLDGWRPLAGGALMAGVGIWQLRRTWLDRWGAAESE